MSDIFDDKELEKENEELEKNNEDLDNQSLSGELENLMKKTDMKTVIPIFIEDEIKSSYLDYSMSVIVSRALPDVRDGLKPVHRRILFAMSELGMTSDKPFKKSARIVGEVLGKYHPHGDSAVYNAMVRMAQDFNTRYELIDGHGNFGSVDGDEAAAMRYTEARMAKITSELLMDIDKNTVDYRKNFDESLDEPVVLPAKLPQLLLNGASGIAVGMATNIPPHNLGEISDAIVALIENREITVDELITHVKGPDFPTGGIIYGRKGIYDAYRTGRGKVYVSGKVNIEELKSGKSNIVINELPYQVNKAKLIEKVADLVKDKRISGISDLRDESDRDGIRVVIEVKKGEEPEVILNKLYKYTDLQTTFGINMLALVDNTPKILNLKQILENYLKHRYDVIVRRTKFELDKAQKRAHILEGFKIALDNIDEVIKIIRGSKDANIAKDNLVTRFLLTEIQAKSILDMRLQRLTGLERNKIEEEYNSLILLIDKYNEILKNDYMIYDIIKEEVIELKEKYNDKRRTEIQSERTEINEEDLIKNEEVVITVTEKGYMKRMSVDTYKTQNRGGIGVNATNTLEDDYVKLLTIANSHDSMLIFTNKGRVYSMKAYQVPELTKQARGKLIQNIVSFEENETLSNLINVEKIDENKSIVFITTNGKVLRVNMNKFSNIRSNGKKAIKLEQDAEVAFVGISNNDDNIFIATKKSKLVIFNGEQIRTFGLNASGVMGVKLAKDDIVISGGLIEKEKINENTALLSITDNGFSKMTPIIDYRETKRGAKGVNNNKTNDKTGDIVGVFVVTEEEKEHELLMISNEGTMIRTQISQISTVGRVSKGVITMRVREGEKIVSVTKINPEN